MKKTIVFLSLLSPAAVLAAHHWQPGSLDDALAKAEAEGKPLLVDFFAENGGTEGNLREEGEKSRAPARAGAHSYFRTSAGLARAARTACPITVSWAMIRVAATATTKIHQPRDIR